MNESISREAERVIQLGVIVLIVIMQTVMAPVKPPMNESNSLEAESVILQVAVFTYCHNAKCHGSR
jgi:hypothetical protein